MPKLFWGQPPNGSLLVQLNFMTSKTCAQVFLITQELCKVQKAGSGTGPHHKFFSAACQWFMCSTRVFSCTILCSVFPRADYCVLPEFCRVPFCVLCSPEVIIVSCVLCFSDLYKGDYSGALNSTVIVHRGDYCGVHHPAHHVTRGIAWPTRRPPIRFLEMFSPRQAMRLWGVFQTQLSFCVRCRGILAGWRITSILPLGQTREGEISIIWRRPSGDTSLGQYRSTGHLVF